MLWSQLCERIALHSRRRGNSHLCCHAQEAYREQRVTGRRQEQRLKLEQLTRGRKRGRSHDDDNDGEGGGGDGEPESDGDAAPSAAKPPRSARISAREPSPLSRPLQRSRESMATSSLSPRPSPVREGSGCRMSDHASLTLKTGATSDLCLIMS